MIGSQKVAGNNNQQAGRDINNISNYFESAKRIPSAIDPCCQFRTVKLGRF